MTADGKPSPNSSCILLGGRFFNEVSILPSVYILIHRQNNQKRYKKTKKGPYFHLSNVENTHLKIYISRSIKLSIGMITPKSQKVNARLGMSQKFQG